jgi:lipid-A-disaccharide synthase-like uncharacterized protein
MTYLKNKMNKQGSVGGVIFFILALIGGFVLLKYFGVI